MIRNNVQCSMNVTKIHSTKEHVCRVSYEEQQICDHRGKWKYHRIFKGAVCRA